MVLNDQFVASALAAPKLSFDLKKQLLEQKLPGAGPLATNLVCFLALKGRLHIFRQMVEEFERLVDAYHGIEHAEITSPFPIDEAERKALAERLAGVLGKKQVVLETKVNKSILGGVVVRIGDKLIDGSSRTRLDNLKRNLQSGVSIS